jgi:hypothetical protein
MFMILVLRPQRHDYILWFGEEVCDGDSDGDSDRGGDADGDADGDGNGNDDLVLKHRVRTV